MKKTKFSAGILVFFTALVAALCLFVACGGEKTKPITVTLEKQTVSFYVADTERVTATLSRELAEGEKLTWTSDKEEVVTVKGGSGASATLQAKGVGTAVVTVSIGDSSATCAVTVQDRTVTMNNPAYTTLDIVSGPKTLQLEATSSDGGAVSWSTSNANIASVQDGLVTATGKGEVVITATRGAASDSCTITVNAPDDYYGVNSGVNATVVATPDTWFYFVKSAHASRCPFAESPYYANGAINMSFSDMSTTEGDDTEYALRYQPSFNVGDTYTVTLKITLNVAGDVKFSPEGAENPVVKSLQVGVNEITIESLVIDESKPFTIRPLIYSMPAEGNLVITLSDIAFTKTADASRA